MATEPIEPLADRVRAAGFQVAGLVVILAMAMLTVGFGPLAVRPTAGAVGRAPFGANTAALRPVAVRSDTDSSTRARRDSAAHAQRTPRTEAGKLSPDSLAIRRDPAAHVRHSGTDTIKAHGATPESAAVP